MTPLGRGVIVPVGGLSAMLCSKCRKNTATTGDGLCDGCPAGPVVDGLLAGTAR